MLWGPRWLPFSCVALFSPLGEAELRLHHPSPPPRPRRKGAGLKLAVSLQVWPPSSQPSCL